MPIIYSYPIKTTPTSSDLITISDSDDGNITKQATLGTALTGSTLSTGTPATAAATGTTGTLQYDASYLYVCVATDTWKRVGIATW